MSLSRKRQFGLFALLVVVTVFGVWFALVKSAPATTILLTVTCGWMGASIWTLMRTRRNLAANEAWKAAGAPYWWLIGFFLLAAVLLLLSVLGYFLR